MSAAEKLEFPDALTPVRLPHRPTPTPQVLYTPQEYLRREAESKTKNEYIQGVIYPWGNPYGLTNMAGGSLEHTTLCSDVFRALDRALDAYSTCGVYNSDLKARVSNAGPYFYPDVTVVCGDIVTDEEDCVRNPIIVAEVLSPSTEQYDRGIKFQQYRRIESLRHCIFVEQDVLYVEHWAKQADGTWSLVGDHRHIDDILTLSDPDLSIPVREIYRRVLPESAISGSS